MKTRHLVLGLGVVLALSVAVPALGGPLHLRASGISKVKQQVKKALIAATSAQRLAAGAQTTANEAQGTASGAQTAAGAAKTAANSAQATANSALGKAGTAEIAAANAATKATGAENKATDALTAANARYKDALPPVTNSVTGSGAVGAFVQCPGDTKAAGGGFAISGGATLTSSEPEGNGWSVTASKPNGSFRVTAWAICLTH